MAFIVKISKVSENEIDVIYSFCSVGNTEEPGELCIDKTSGEIELIKPFHHMGFYMRAATKVRKSWQEGKLPDELTWMS